MSERGGGGELQTGGASWGPSARHAGRVSVLLVGRRRRGCRDEDGDGPPPEEHSFSFRLLAVSCGRRIWSRGGPRLFRCSRRRPGLSRGPGEPRGETAWPLVSRRCLVCALPYHSSKFRRSAVSLALGCRPCHEGSSQDVLVAAQRMGHVPPKRSVLWGVFFVRGSCCFPFEPVGLRVVVVAIFIRKF